MDKDAQVPPLMDSIIQVCGQEYFSMHFILCDCEKTGKWGRETLALTLTFPCDCGSPPGSLNTDD